MIEELLEELKEYRNEMVAKNYPFQKISNIITIWEEKLRIAREERRKEVGG